MPVIKKSQLKGAGYGLFAGRNYLKGEFVTKYGGFLITEKEAEKSKSPYLMRDELDQIWDSRFVFNPNLEMGRWINDARDKKKNNTEAISQYFEAPLIFTTRDVAAGEEFFLDYGLFYW